MVDGEPPTFDMGAVDTRRLSIAGFEAAVAGSHVHGSRTALPIVSRGVAHEIDLSALGVGELVELDIAWSENEARATLRDPTTHAARVSPDHRRAPGSGAIVHRRAERMARLCGNNARP